MSTIERSGDFGYGKIEYSAMLARWWVLSWRQLSAESMLIDLAKKRGETTAFCCEVSVDLDFCTPENS
ncbi:MAG: hypothetical protein FWD61_14810 [Phycisphaerales bacterium]|nr:hypothetical protein [Phycisphaerales bacterium]